MTKPVQNTHSIPIGYLFWIFGFMGAHRFYYGKALSGTLYFFTLGLLGIGWIIDLFLIPSMDAKADKKYQAGPVNYTICWALLTFFGYLGIHRFYMKRWISGSIYLITGGLFLVGYLYDHWKLNDLISESNSEGS